MLKTPASGQTALAGFEKKLTGNVPDDSDIPDSVRKAVRFMLAGAAATAVVGIFLLIATIADKNALTDSSGKKLSNSEFTSGVVGTLVTYLVLVTVWILMARLNRAGRSWARIVAIVFFLISTYDAYTLINSLRGGQTITVVGTVYIAFTLLIWLLGLLAVAMLVRTESNAYFKERSAAGR
jgi:hypothetical protein